MKNIFAAVLLFLSYSFVNAQDNETLKSLQDKFENVKSMQADFVQYAKTSSGGEGAKNSGTLYYKAKNKYRVEFKSQIIVSDGEANYNYMTKSKKLLISDKEDQSSSFMVDKFIYEYPKSSKVEDLGSKALGGESLKGFRLIPNKSSQFKSADIWVGPDNMVKQVEIKDKSNAFYVVELSNIRLNHNIDDSQFTIKQTKDMEVIDLR
jgi:chaperone LolA